MNILNLNFDRIFIDYKGIMCTKLDLSVVIITKNEEKNIVKCLEKIKNIANEIIIIDSFSTDKTKEIVNNIKANIIFKEVLWQGYGKTKNFGINLAKSKWILSLDADEVLTDELIKEIEIVINKESDIFGYYVPRTLFFCNKALHYGGTYPDYQLRLFKNGAGLFNNSDVHEKLILNGKKGYLKNSMFHYSYHSIFDYFERFNLYTTLDAEKMYNSGKKINILKLFSFNFRLFNKLIIKRGILDGFYGIFYHFFSSMYPIVKYAKLFEIYQNKKSKNF